MDEITKWIEAHTSFLNQFLPALKGISDALPLPPALHAAFDEAYALAPLVITTGASAVAALNSGPNPMPGATAFAATIDPGPALPLAAAVAAVPPAPPKGPVLLVPVAKPDPETATMDFGVAQLTTAEETSGKLNASQIAALAESLGLTLIGADGNKVSPQ